MAQNRIYNITQRHQTKKSAIFEIGHYENH